MSTDTLTFNSKTVFANETDGARIYATDENETLSIWVGDALYAVIPLVPAQLATDRDGILRFASFAADIHTPAFSCTAGGLQSPPNIYPAEELAGWCPGLRIT